MAIPTSAEMIAEIAQVMRDLGPIPPRQDFSFGSLRYIPRKLREAPPRETPHGWVASSPYPTFGGIKCKIDKNLPPYFAVMREETRDFWNPKFMIFDLRRKPQTDDMAQMVEDLRRFGAVPTP